MMNTALRDAVMRVLPRVKTPAQYIGGELNATRKDHSRVRGKLCLAFPDAYTIGMSHHGLQVLYTLINRRDDWACERVYAPWMDMEAALRARGLPLLSYLDPDSQDTQAIVLTPTRELCIQVTQALRAYGERKGIEVVAIFGGAPIRDQASFLRQGG